MDLDCVNSIITDDLAIHIDLTNIKSWDLNTGLTINSITKWKNTVNDNIELYDYGLTAFDVGATNIMWDNLSLTSKDNYFNMKRIGYNLINNPQKNEYTGTTATTTHLSYDIIPVTTGLSGNYFDLAGGYLQGFFNLFDFNYEMFPTRYARGITIETLINIYPNSSGIFYYMGTRAEDKYNPRFSGETLIKDFNNNNDVIDEDEIIKITGITTSFNNYLESIEEDVKYKKAFRWFEDKSETHYSEDYSIDNLKSNVISFELTDDKRLAYKYIDNNGFIVTNTSQTKITATGFTLITIVFKPNYNIYDMDILQCSERRFGKLMFYINGRLKWVVDEFPEFYFHELNNDPEKQIGVPYNINWGGGSFGLEHSWHYDFQTYDVYTGNNNTYINNNFIITNNPLENVETIIGGVSLSENNTDFTDNQNNTISVMDIEYTGSSATTYFVKFDNELTLLSNRDYQINLSIFNENMFNRFAQNKVSIIAYSNDSDIYIISGNEYKYPIHYSNDWYKLNSRIRVEDNIDKAQVSIGLLIESSSNLNLNTHMYLKDFTYTGADILIKDVTKNNLTIEENFNNSFIGGIQKLRLYDNALTSEEILHNAIIENNSNPNIIVNIGGRLIYR